MAAFGLSALKRLPEIQARGDRKRNTQNRNQGSGYATKIAQSSGGQSPMDYAKQKPAGVTSNPGVTTKGGGGLGRVLGKALNPTSQDYLKKLNNGYQPQHYQADATPNPNFGGGMLTANASKIGSNAIQTPEAWGGLLNTPNIGSTSVANPIMAQVAKMGGVNIAGPQRADVTSMQGVNVGGPMSWNAAQTQAAQAQGPWQGVLNQPSIDRTFTQAATYDPESSFNLFMSQAPEMQGLIQKDMSRLEDQARSRTQRLMNDAIQQTTGEFANLGSLYSGAAMNTASQRAGEIAGDTAYQLGRDQLQAETSRANAMLPVGMQLAQAASMLPSEYAQQANLQQGQTDAQRAALLGQLGNENQQLYGRLANDVNLQNAGFEQQANLANQQATNAQRSQTADEMMRRNLAQGQYDFGTNQYNADAQNTAARQFADLLSQRNLAQGQMDFNVGSQNMNAQNAAYNNYANQMSARNLAQGQIDAQRAQRQAELINANRQLYGNQVYGANTLTAQNQFQRALQNAQMQNSRDIQRAQQTFNYDQLRSNNDIAQMNANTNMIINAMNALGNYGNPNMTADQYAVQGGGGVGGGGGGGIADAINTFISAYTAFQ